MSGPMIPLARLPGDPAIPDPLVAEWLGHYEAGRYGTRQPLAPEHLANLEHTDAILRAAALGRAAAARAAFSGAAR